MGREEGTAKLVSPGGVNDRVGLLAGEDVEGNTDNPDADDDAPLSLAKVFVIPGPCLPPFRDTDETSFPT